MKTMTTTLRQQTGNTENDQGKVIGQHIGAGVWMIAMCNKSNRVKLLTLMTKCRRQDNASKTIASLSMKFESILVLQQSLLVQLMQYINCSIATQEND